MTKALTTTSITNINLEKANCLKKKVIKATPAKARKIVLTSNVIDPFRLPYRS